MAGCARAAQAQRPRNDGGDFIREPATRFARQAVMTDFEIGEIARPLDDASAAASHARKGFSNRFHLPVLSPYEIVYKKLIALFGPDAAYCY